MYITFFSLRTIVSLDPMTANGISPFILALDPATSSSSNAEKEKWTRPNLHIVVGMFRLKEWLLENICATQYASKWSTLIILGKIHEIHVKQMRYERTDENTHKIPSGLGLSIGSRTYS